MSRDNESGFSDMTIYTTPNGTIVFATGSIQWSWGLDDFNGEARGSRLNAQAQQITRNVLGRMLARAKRRAVSAPASTAR